MANTKSAIKRTRKIKRQTAVNRSRKSRYRGALKKMNSIIEKKDKMPQGMYRELQKKLILYNNLQ